MKSIDDKNRTSQNLLNTTGPVFRVNVVLKFTESYKKVGAVRIKIKIATSSMLTDRPYFKRN